MKVERPRARSSAAPTRENSRSTAPMRARSARHEAACLGENRDQRVLAQERALARHVRPGQQPQTLARGQIGVVGDERRRGARERLLDHGVPATLSDEGITVLDLGAAVALLRGQLREAGGDVQAASARAVRPDRLGVGQHRPAQRLEQLQLEGERTLGGARDPALQLRQLPVL